MDVFFSNLGCKLNQAEVEKWAREFRAAGHRVVGSLEEAGLHVVNSCTVTHVAARDSRKTSRRGARLDNPPLTVLSGCYASGSPEEAAALAGVDLVVPNTHKDQLVDIVHRSLPEVVPVVSSDAIPVSYVPLEFMNSRAAVKVEDGCNMSCAFCIIPQTRGRQRSRPVDQIVEEVAGLAAGGAAEVIVTGVQISSYRDGSARLADLVRSLLDGTDVPRLRLTSIAPWQFDDRLFELFPDPRLCRHFHLSLQSGCDDTLRRMRRPYDSEGFARLVERLRDRVPGVAITTDVIVGFPGETESEFERSLAFVRHIGFAKVHAFTYSERDGTLAAELPDPVDPMARRVRVKLLREAAETAEEAFWRSQLGRSVEVLWEEERNGHWLGMTDNYVRVACDSAPPSTLEHRRLASIADRRVLVSPLVVDRGPEGEPVALGSTVATPSPTSTSP